MTRLISATRKIKVIDTQGEHFILTFKIPSQSKLRGLRKASLSKDGGIDSLSFSDKLNRETADLLLEVEGAQAGFDDTPENDFAVCSTMSEDRIRRIKEFYEQNELEFFSGTSGWKAAFISLFRDVFERAEAALWANGTELDASLEK